MVRDPTAYLPERDTGALNGPDVDYRPAPGDLNYGLKTKEPVWRVRFDVIGEYRDCFGLDINGEVILGRRNDAARYIDLSPYDAARLGVSRHHMTIRPTPTHLFAIDMGSTNGTMRNGRSIGLNSPSRLVNGDVLTLGRLQLVVSIVGRPTFETALLGSKPTPSLADALSQIAKSITSQLELDEVLNQVTEAAMLLTSAGETSIWLVDEISGELFLKAQRGIEDEKIKHMRLPIRQDNLAGQVIKTGKPLHAQRQPGEEQIKVKTHYLVEELLYVPIILGGVSLGVVSAVHRERDKQFHKQDESLLMAIADFAAIAIQNARLYEATDEALQRRVKELSALNEVSRSVSASLDLDQVYKVFVHQVNRHWPVESVSLFLVDEVRNLLRAHPDSQLGDGPVTLPMGEGLIGQVALDGELLVDNDLGRDSDKLSDLNFLGDRKLKSIACFPLQIQDRVVGVLVLLNKADGSFDGEDIDRLVAFANPVATAIENAHLFAESERQRAAILATARTLNQPLMILDDEGAVLVSNQVANQILETHMAQLFEGISTGLGRTSEIQIGNLTYLSTAQHLEEVGTIVVMQDITYVKQLEEDRAEFMHALSHDLKSPLTSIMGWAQLLEKVITLDERGTKYMGKLVASAERMLELINQMLQTVARGDDVKTDRKPCDIGDVLQTALADAEGAALHKSISISLETSGEPYDLLVDASRLYHMILNLVDNAIKYSPANTKIAVRLEYSEESVMIRVQDEGAGIPEEDLPRLFDKYYRGTTAKVQPGAGLGLSVVWAIANAHGGRVTARNRREGGAEFVATLPGTLRVSTERLVK